MGVLHFRRLIKYLNDICVDLCQVTAQENHIQFLYQRRIFFVFTGIVHPGIQNLLLFVLNTKSKIMFAGDFLQAADDKDSPAENSRGAGSQQSYERETSQQGCNTGGQHC